MARPAVEIRITGRRPCWSDSEPITGEARNCISAHRATNTPLMMPPRALEPVNCSIGVGSAGMTMPIDRTSSNAGNRGNEKEGVVGWKATGGVGEAAEVGGEGERGGGEGEAHEEGGSG